MPSTSASSPHGATSARRHRKRAPRAGVGPSSPRSRRHALAIAQPGAPVAGGGHARPAARARRPRAPSRRPASRPSARPAPPRGPSRGRSPGSSSRPRAASARRRGRGARRSRSRGRRGGDRARRPCRRSPWPGGAAASRQREDGRRPVGEDSPLEGEEPAPRLDGRAPAARRAGPGRRACAPRSPGPRRSARRPSSRRSCPPRPSSPPRSRDRPPGCRARCRRWSAATRSRSGLGQEPAALAELLDGVGERHVAAGDRGGPGAAIGLDDVAVDGDRALAELRRARSPRAASGRRAAGSRGCGRPVRPASRPVRVDVARGSMPYSAVTQPCPLPRRNGGTRSSTEAVQITRVSPTSTSTAPSACRV